MALVTRGKDSFYVEYVQKNSTANSQQINQIVRYPSALISDPENWDLSVVSWSLPITTGSVPVPFASMRKIIFYTTTIPVRGDIENEGASKQKITDFRPDAYQIASAGSPNILIFSANLHRFYPLYGNQPLQQMNIYATVEDNLGNEYPLSIPPLDIFACKLYFRRRNSNVPY